MPVRRRVCFAMNNACQADKSIGIILFGLCRPAHTIMIIRRATFPHRGVRVLITPVRGRRQRVGTSCIKLTSTRADDIKIKQNNLCVGHFSKFFRRLVLETSARGASNNCLSAGHRLHKLLRWNFLSTKLDGHLFSSKVIGFDTGHVTRRVGPGPAPHRSASDEWPVEYFTVTWSAATFFLRLVWWIFVSWSSIFGRISWIWQRRWTWLDVINHVIYRKPCFLLNVSSCSHKILVALITCNR